MSKKITTGVFLLVILLHLGSGFLIVQRYPAPMPTFHQFDQQLLKYPFVLRGSYKGSGSPIEDIAPAEIALDSPWGPEQEISVYKNAKPLYLLLSAVPASLFGISLASLRMGGGAVFVLAMLLLFDLLRRMKEKTSGLVGLVAFSCSPIAWQSILIPAPFLAIMCGVLLCLWSLWNSHFFTKKWASLLSGIAVGILPFWGETAGDSIPALLVCIPMLCCYGLVAGWRKKRSSIIGLGLCLGAIWFLLPVPWLEFQVWHYIVQEAQVNTDSLAIPWAGLYRVIFNLAQSLLLPSLFALAILAWAFARKQVWTHLWLLTGIVPLVLATMWSQKSYDYYLSAVVPLLIIPIGLNYASDWRRYFYAILGGITIISWFLLRNIDIDFIRHQVPTILFQDQNVLQGSISSVHMFQHWRRPLGFHQQKRNDIVGWFLQEEGKDILAKLKTASLVLVYDSQNSDVIQYVATVSRPDILFHRTALGPPTELTKALIAHYDDIYVTMSNGVQNPCTLDSGLLLQESIRKSRDVCLWKVQGYR